VRYLSTYTAVFCYSQKVQRSEGTALKSCDKREFCQSRLNTTQIPVRSHFLYAVERCQKQ